MPKLTTSITLISLKAVLQRVILFTSLNIFFINFVAAESILYKYPDPSKSVVSIEAMHLESNGHVLVKTASGFIIDTNGYIATNATFIDRKDLIRVHLNDGRTIDATVVGLDRRMDTGLLKISANNLTPIIIGSTSKLNASDDVYALQNNGDIFPKNVMEGKVLQIKKNMNPIYGFIEANLPLSLGMSGGPLFNRNGEIIGVNTAKYVGPTEQQKHLELSFSIPIEGVMKVVNELRIYGRVKWGTLGFVVQDVTPEIVKAFELSDTSGAMVNSVEKDKPAAKTDIASGDILLAIAGKKIQTPRDYVSIVNELLPGTEVTIEVLKLRTKKIRKFTLTVAEANS